MAKELHPDENKRRVEKQRAIAKRIEADQAEQEAKKQAAHTNTMATVDTHVGLAPHDTPKPREMEAAKTGLENVTGVDEDVTRVPMKTEGETTDEVTTDPAAAAPQPDTEGFQNKVAAAAAGGAKSGAKKNSAKKSSGRR